jgi:G3E family GTPase
LEDSKVLPCYLLTGILGAGKTTLLNHILRHAEGRFAVLVNELGAIDVDGELVETNSGSQLSLANGCICCTINDDLEKTVLRLLGSHSNLDGLIVEASGVADPQPIVSTFLISETLRSRLRVESVIAVVDLEAFPLLRGKSAFLARRQAAASDLTVLNKSDLVSDEQIGAVRKALQEWVPRLRTVSCSDGTVPLAVLLGGQRFHPDQLPTGRPVEVHIHSSTTTCSGHSGEELVLDTWCYESAGTFRPRALLSELRNLSPSIYRAKGFVWLQDEEEVPFSVQLSGTRVDLRKAGPATEISRFENRLVFLGEQGSLAGPELELKLKEAMEERQELHPSEELMEKVRRILT